MTQWERGDDPMTQSAFTGYRDEAGTFDPFGRPLSVTRIACPRGWRAMDERPVEPFLASRERTLYAAPADPADYIHNRAAKATTFEITGSAGKRIDDLVALADADPSLKVIGQSLTFYDGPAFTGLPLGQVGPYGAITRAESLVLTDDILDAAYGAAVPPYLAPGGAVAWTGEYPAPFLAALPAIAGYVHYPGGADPSAPKGYYSCVNRRRYDFQSGQPAKGLLIETLDPLHVGAEPAAHRQTIAYDDYAFLPVRVTDAAGLTTSATNDYRLLQAKEAVDPNGNISRVAFSPLGLAISTYILGKNATEGDRLRPSARLEYDFLAFENSPPENRQPIYARTIRHIHHDGDTDIALADRDETITTEYSDGFGRLLQTRVQAEDTRFGDPQFGGGETVLPALQSDGAGGDVTGFTNADRDAPNVLVSGWQVYDNKGRVVERYEVLFSKGWAYSQPDDAEFGQKVAMFRDPRGNVVRTVNADGSEQRVVMGVPGTIAAPDLAALDDFEPTPWESYAYDPNDNAGRTHPAASAGYAHHWSTPTSSLLDPMGRTIEQVARNRDPPAAGAALPPIVGLRTRTVYDLRGNVVTQVDAMGRAAFDGQVYDLANRKLASVSIDAGERRTVFDAGGNIVESRDGRGALTLRAHDGLNRPVRLWARDGAAQALTLRERIDYGDAGSPAQPAAERAAARAANRLGKVARHFDEAGVVRFERYDFKGNLVEKVRQVVGDAALLAGFAGPPAGWTVEAFRADWTDVDDPPLDATLYRVSSSFDALNRPKSITYPAGVDNLRRRLVPRYNRAGALDQVRLDNTVFVERIAYNARGQRVLVAYGNGVMTRSAYDPRTCRLARLRTERFTAAGPLAYRPAGAVFQDLAYEVDLAGNVLAIHDRAPESGILNAPLGKNALDRRFVHDALYHLSSASGRECDLPPDILWDAARRPTDLTKTRGYDETYRYDAAGNLTSLRHVSNGPGFTRTFAQAAGTNRLKTLTVGPTAFDYAYDVNGNMTGETASRHYVWDHADRMRAYRTQAGAAEPTVHAQYLYDAAGQRVKKLVRKQGGQVEVTVYIDGLFEHRTVRTGANVTVNNTLHVSDNGSRVATVRVGSALAGDATPTVKYALADHLGSSNVVLDDAGALVSREEYTPYGETSFGSHALKRYRFCGKERDEESGLVYFGSRYHAPWLGRWVSCDPAGPIDGLNLYCYVSDRPINAVDPIGRQEKESLPGGTGNTPEEDAKGAQPKAENVYPGGKDIAPVQENDNQSKELTINLTAAADTVKKAGKAYAQKFVEGTFVSGMIRSTGDKKLIEEYDRQKHIEDLHLMSQFLEDLTH
ncbi:hypothetical protein AEGHOMDF_4971 [Methylobacterium soli]|uniref:RHS repeat domain-containing protein n=1 Tax=Methylobacterium soli TaxID=553447 RepID=UPI001EE2B02C|nr:RHS repeat-associated core domain-containing protein [Methylobacterium soli]GJE45771.1 hypothetical protein AEGHOMDF_4971 [Methylobacterium soli]